MLDGGGKTSKPVSQYHANGEILRERERERVYVDLVVVKDVVRPCMLLPNTEIVEKVTFSTWHLPNLTTTSNMPLRLLFLLLRFEVAI